MKTFRRWSPAIIICLIIFVSSSRQGTAVVQDDMVNFLANKGAHLVLYFVLCFSFYRGTKSVVGAVVLTVIYGSTDEFHQQFVPTRTGQLTDIVIDSVAAIYAGLILWIFYQNLPKKLKNWLEV